MGVIRFGVELAPDDEELLFELFELPEFPEPDGLRSPASAPVAFLKKSEIPDDDDELEFEFPLPDDDALYGSILRIEESGVRFLPDCPYDSGVSRSARAICPYEVRCAPSSVS